GPLERGSVPLPEPRARDARELERHREGRDSARQGIQALDAEAVGEGTPAGIDDESVEDELDDEELLATAPASEPGESLYDPLGGTAPDGYAPSLPTTRGVPFGISRKRLEQAIRELQLPVVVVRDLEEADVVMTLRSA